MTPEADNIVSRYVQRRVLLFSLLLLALLFAITAGLARTYHAREEGLVSEWFQKGNADLADGKPAQAFEDFRNSLSYGPANSNVQLRLAEALLADGRFIEARSYLVNLWDRAPGSGEVNLDLAHVSVQTGDMDQSIRYFRGAISGNWEKEPALQRRKVRLEFCEFLLAHRQTSDAEAEVAGLAADTPADNGALREENGRLFLRVGEPGKALAEFEAALHINPRQSQWLADAGQVAFEDGDYLKAEAYFSKADRENPSDEIKNSVQAAVAWFKKVEIKGIKELVVNDTLGPEGRDRIVVADPSAPPMWARFYEIGSNKPFFCSRDGVKRFNLSEISYERRNHYSWLGYWPQRMLSKEYPEWAKKNGLKNVLE